jgi:PilZ domain
MSADTPKKSSAPRDDRRRASRQPFSPPYNARIVSVDGTRFFPCRVSDVSQSGAKLAIIEGAKIPDTFFLALSSRGSAHRNCEVVWRTAKAVGVRFVIDAPTE